jgi:hypothetical protein
MQPKTMLPGPVTCLLDGRIEKRVPMALATYLISFEEQPVIEKVLTENVSHHAARVVAKRRWPPGQQLWIAPLSDKPESPAKVVYCHGLSSGLFCLGLEFGAGLIKWGEGPWRSTPYENTHGYICLDLKERQDRNELQNFQRGFPRRFPHESR